MNREELRQFLLSLWRDGFISMDDDVDMSSYDVFNAWFEYQLKARLTSTELKKLSN